jgi:hypothetical protein
MVVRIVTVTPPKVFDYVDSTGSKTLTPATQKELAGAACLLRYKVVDDYAVNLDRLAGKFRRRELGRHGCGLGRGTQQRMT